MWPSLLDESLLLSPPQIHSLIVFWQAERLFMVSRIQGGINKVFTSPRIQGSSRKDTLPNYFCLAIQKRTKGS